MSSLPPTDAALLRASGRDAAAFHALYDRYAESVHGFFARRTGGGDGALDLTAETFAQAWLSRDRFEDRFDGCAGPWLFGIARNVLRQSVRRRRVEAAARERLGLLGGVDREHIVADPTWLDGMDDDLVGAIAALPNGQREAVVLRFVADLSYDDISTRLACTPLAARIRVSRALSAVRATMEELSDG